MSLSLDSYLQQECCDTTCMYKVTWEQLVTTSQTTCPNIAQPLTYSCTLHSDDIVGLEEQCYIGIDLDLSKPKGMPFDLKLHTYSFTTKYINMAKA